MGPVQAAFQGEIPKLSAPGFEAGEPGMTFLWLPFNLWSSASPKHVPVPHAAGSALP